MLINKKHVRQFALEESERARNGKFRRVSLSFLMMVDRRLASIIAQEVFRHPGVGKTLMGHKPERNQP